jgi:hypothetical protein
MFYAIFTSICTNWRSVMRQTIEVYYRDCVFYSSYYRWDRCSRLPGDAILFCESTGDSDGLPAMYRAHRFRDGVEVAILVGHVIYI